MKYTLPQRLSRARALKAQGCNCAQCLLLAFDDVAPGDASLLAAAARGFGSGMAVGDTCGALTGGIMALGMASDGLPRAQMYGRVSELTHRFEQLEGSRMCRDLKCPGASRPCGDIIADGVRLLHNMLEEEA